MSLNVILLIVLPIAIIAGFLIGKLLEKNKLSHKIVALSTEIRLVLEERNSTKENIRKLIEEKELLATEKHELALQLSIKVEYIKKLEERMEEQQKEVAQLQEKFSKDFEILANKILEDKSSKFAHQNKEQLSQILNPLQEKILSFEKKVETTHKESIDYHAALRQQIVGLKELNEQMSKEALNLTKALKGDSKAQGNWGELVLENVLEKSGLEKGREYFVQQHFTDESGKKVIPDVVIHLPGEKKIIIDSKVSLTAYERYTNETDEVLKANSLKEHLKSINKHVEQLSSKKYEQLNNTTSPDFVLLFIPIEPAFALALNNDAQLYNKAFEKNIVIVTPTTLLATLRTIDTMWNNEKQQKNAIEIARQAGALYDKFEGFVSDLMRVGKKMDEAKKEYGGAMNKLVEGNGNLVVRVERLKKMGITSKKTLPQNILDRATDSEINID